MNRDEMNDLLEQKFAQFFGQMTEHFDERLKAEIGPLSEKVDQLQVTLDADTKRTETDEQERVFLGHQVDRHEGWIRQLADNTGTKLASEQ